MRKSKWEFIVGAKRSDIFTPSKVKDFKMSGYGKTPSEAFRKAIGKEGDKDFYIKHFKRN